MATEVDSTTKKALWTVDEVSAFLRVPVGTLYAWRHRGSGPPAVRLGRHLRYPRDLLDEWLRSGLAESAQENPR
jgi:excisionase family DNA binding protein